MSLENFMAICPVDFEIFHRISRNPTMCNGFGRHMMLSWVPDNIHVALEGNERDLFVI